MQTLNTSGSRENWFALSRCEGIFRYHWRALGTTVAWVLAVLLGSSVLGMILPAIFPNENFNMGGISTNEMVAQILALVCGCVVAGRGTRFLLRFGTPRFSVWLCNLLSLAAAMLAILLGSLLISILIGYLTLALSQSGDWITLVGYASQGGLLRGSALLSATLSEALQRLPGQMAHLMEWVSLYYLFGCCLRRKRWLTLTVVIGVPLAVTILMVVPAVRETIDIATSGRQNELLVTGMRWMGWLADALRFMRNEWPTIQLVAAIASLPLSYLCMRGTKQP